MATGSDIGHASSMPSTGDPDHDVETRQGEHGMYDFHQADSPDPTHDENLNRIFGGPDGVAHAKARLAKIGPKLMERMQEASELGNQNRVRDAARDLVGALSLFESEHVLDTGRTAALYNDMAMRFDLCVNDPQFLGDAQAKSMFPALKADI